MESSILEEIADVYADECDFITEIERTKEKIYEKVKEIMKSVSEQRKDWIIKCWCHKLQRFSSYIYYI